MHEGEGRRQEKVGFRKSWVRSGSPFFTAEHLLYAQHMGRCRKMRRSVLCWRVRGLCNPWMQSVEIRGIHNVKF